MKQCDQSSKCSPNRHALAKEKYVTSGRKMWWAAAYLIYIFFSEKNGGARGYEELLTHLLLNK